MVYLLAAEAGDISKVLNFGHLSVTVPANEAHLREGGPSRVEPKYLDLARNRNMFTHTHSRLISMCRLGGLMCVWKA